MNEAFLVRWLPAVAVLTACTGCHSSKCTMSQENMSATPPTGFLCRSIDLDGETLRYSIYVPDSYTPARAWPAILFLHGMGERGTDGVSHTAVGLGRAIRMWPERFPCIVVMPQCPPDRRWEGPTLKMALATLDATEDEYDIDTDRVVLTGLSMGGFGSWTLGATHGARFSALVPICGGGDVANAPALARVPIWCFHGADDPVVPVQRSRGMVEAVRQAGGTIRYTEYAGVGHNSWDAAYQDADLSAWMLAQTR